MARKAVDAKAEGVVILDLRKLSYSFEYFVLCSVESDRRVQTIADDIREALSNGGERWGHAEGQSDGGWVLLDYGPVVCHLFAPEMREFYGLERLWADAPRVAVPKQVRR